MSHEPITVSVRSKPSGSHPGEGTPEPKKDETPAGTTKETQETQQTERPSWLPEKFASPEALAAAYSELEKKQGSTPKPKSSSDSLPTIEKTTEGASDSSAEEPSFDLNALAQELATSGTLSDESVKALTAKGLTPATVAAYAEGQKALLKQTREALATAAGGEQDLVKIVEWAGSNYSPDEQAAYNSAVNSGNLHLAKMAVQGLRARYLDSVGNPGKRVEGSPEGGEPGAAVAFKSASEMSAAMRDRRYQSDAEYRASVMRRVEVSPRFFG